MQYLNVPTGNGNIWQLCGSPLAKKKKLLPNPNIRTRLRINGGQMQLNLDGDLKWCGFGRFKKVIIEP